MAKNPLHWASEVQFLQEAAYMVRFTVAGNPTVEQLFNERWQAEAFRDSCTEQMDAKVIVLWEEKK